jgi:hypothetical protein
MQKTLAGGYGHHHPGHLRDAPSTIGWQRRQSLVESPSLTAQRQKSLKSLVGLAGPEPATRSL